MLKAWLRRREGQECQLRGEGAHRECLGAREGQEGQWGEGAAGGCPEGEAAVEGMTAVAGEEELHSLGAPESFGRLEQNTNVTVLRKLLMAGKFESVPILGAG